jgi:hypothetical protein
MAGLNVSALGTTISDAVLNVIGLGLGAETVEIEDTVITELLEDGCYAESLATLQQLTWSKARAEKLRWFQSAAVIETEVECRSLSLAGLVERKLLEARSRFDSLHG